MSAAPLTPLPNQLLATAERHGEETFLHHLGRDWSFSELLEAAYAVADWLAECGVGRNDRVAMALPNGQPYVAAYFGILLAGACAVTVDVETLGSELRWILEHCGAAAAVLAPEPAVRLVGAGGVPDTVRGVLLTEMESKVGATPERSTLFDELQPGRPRRCSATVDDLAQIIYTSGTTGRPKGVTLTHRCLAANTRSIVSALGLQPRDSVLAVLPFSYSYGNSLLLTHAAVGGRLIMPSDFVFIGEAVDLMEAQMASGFAGVPTSFALMFARSDLLHRPMANLRYVTCAGGALPQVMIDRFRASLPHVRVYVMYGQTEASARLTTLQPSELETRPGSVGQPIAGVSITIRDEQGHEVPNGKAGEVVVKGDNVMIGYWNDPDGTSSVLRADGLHTGDLGWKDDAGYVYIVGRRSDMIKSGGYRISPQEVEDALLELESVAEVGVVGKPDPILGEAVAAFVVPQRGHTCTAEAVLEHARRRLPRTKLVREVHLVDGLPRTTSGKLRRSELREMILGGPNERPS